MPPFVGACFTSSSSRIKEPVFLIRNPAAKEFLMTARTLTALCFSLALSGASAQTTPAAAQPPKPAAGGPAKPAARETPPDQKAYTEAGKLTDPEKKIAALENSRRTSRIAHMPQSPIRRFSAR